MGNSPILLPWLQSQWLPKDLTSLGCLYFILIPVSFSFFSGSCVGSSKPGSLCFCGHSWLMKQSSILEVRYPSKWFSLSVSSEIPQFYSLAVLACWELWVEVRLTAPSSHTRLWNTDKDAQFCCFVQTAVCLVFSPGDLHEQ